MHMVGWISTVCYYHLPRIYRCMTKITGDVIRSVSLLVESHAWTVEKGKKVC